MCVYIYILYYIHVYIYIYTYDEYLINIYIYIYTHPHTHMIYDKISRTSRSNGRYPKRISSCCRLDQFSTALVVGTVRSCGRNNWSLPSEGTSDGEFQLKLTWGLKLPWFCTARDVQSPLQECKIHHELWAEAETDGQCTEFWMRPSAFTIYFQYLSMLSDN